MDNQKFYIELDKETILSLPRPEAGEIAYATDTEEFLVFNGDEWVHQDPPELEDGIKMPVYELERSMAMGYPAYNLTKAKENINSLKDLTNSKFYMLYGKECSYFTLFEHCNENWDVFNFNAAVIECAQDLGEIKYCELTENKDAIEIWVTHEELGATCLYLFPYDNGVVRVKE